MKNLIPGLIFFICFYRLSYLNDNLYLSLFFSLAAFSVLSAKNFYDLKVMKNHLPAISIFLFMVFFSFCVDLYVGSLILQPLNTFTVRLISIIVISFLPAYFLYHFYLKFNNFNMQDVIVVAFILQTLFWFITFIDPSYKFHFSNLMGFSADSVNLRDHNISTRGFGISTEMNYTSPFMTVLVSLIFLRNYFLILIVFFTQLINSTLVLFAFILGLFAPYRITQKVLVLFSLILLIYNYGDGIFSRFYSEFDGGQSRTINALINDHFFILNDGIFENLFGMHEYVFNSNVIYNSDIGWVIMYNYGGGALTISFVLLLVALSSMAFKNKIFSFIWFFSAVILNTKGLLLSPNSFFFMTFILILLNNNPKFIFTEKK